MRLTLFVTLALTAASTLVAGHGQEVHSPTDPRVLSAWDQATLLGLGVVAALYLIGAQRLRARGARQSRLEQAACAAGWLALVVAVLPWVDAASIEWFSAHMAQHELMMLVGAPLLIAGRPLATCLWGLPEGWRDTSIAIFQHRAYAGTVRMLTTPVIAWALHGTAVWLWHVPALYELAVGNEAAHTVQHAMFIGTSLLFWGGLLHGRYGRAGYGAATFFVFATAVHTGILGALFAITGTPLYSVYINVPGMTAETALADQQVAGLVMWIPAGILLTLVGIALFAAWLGEAERRTRVSHM